MSLDIENIPDYKVKILDKGESGESFSLSVEIEGETFGHTFPKNGKWFSEREGVPLFIWKLRSIYKKKFEDNLVEDKKLDDIQGEY